jgi:HAD hydrolase, family IA, variant 1
MFNCQNIFFDLDGTITKSGLGITRSVKKGLEAVGIIENDLEKLNHFIGPPLYDSFIKYYNLNEKDYKIALHAFHERYTSIGIFECEVYEGMENLLKDLRENGKKLYVATSKPEFEARRVIEHFNLNKYFEFVGGSDGDHNCERPTKAHVIKYVLDSCHLNQKDCIMIGDKSHDIIGAKSNNLLSIGVLYGYGNLEELEKAGADFICKNTKEIEKLLL